MNTPLITSVVVAVTVFVAYKWNKYKKKNEERNNESYSLLKSLLTPYHQTPPTQKHQNMVVSLDNLDFNIGNMCAVARGGKKTIRLATKSVRVPDLIKYILAQDTEVFKGLMCYSVEEAFFLSAALKISDDILIGYPTVQPHDLETALKMHNMGIRITLVVDEAFHIDLLDSFFTKNITNASDKMRVCIDLDTSFHFCGFSLGAHRSPVRTVAQVAQLVEKISLSKQLLLVGVLAYEGHIAGVPDNDPFQSVLLNLVTKEVKKIFAKQVQRQRKEILEFLQIKKISLEFFNGGGSGNIEEAAIDDTISEISAGSGLLQSHLFDYYKSNKSRPAMYFALQTTRIHSANVITCQSGGYIASGSILCFDSHLGGNKAPVPFLPSGLKLFADEGFGEVQTPLLLPYGVSLSLGDPVFFRPSKAGEIAERFNEYLLRRGDTILEKVKTYRGYGYAFF